MRYIVGFCLLSSLWVSSVQAQGLLLPTDKSKSTPKLVRQSVHVEMQDQVAVTRVVQVFRNNSSEDLEATYVFPVPENASVSSFVMWVDGKKVKGEVMAAKKARKIYTNIVRQMKDPGLLEYMDHKLFRVRVYPVKAHSDQKLSITFTAVAKQENGLVEYVYPLQAGKHQRQAKVFSLKVDLQSQHSLHNIYSPSHDVVIKKISDKKAQVRFRDEHVDLDKDFRLFYKPEASDIGLTGLFHRPDAEKDGYFMLLLSPRAELAKAKQVPRDVVFVLDTSGSMQGKRITQAQAALNHCLANLGTEDRFAIVKFATTVSKYEEDLLESTSRNVRNAQRWVNNLSANGSTNIDKALKTAVDMCPENSDRNFTIVFFTDGMPTVGERNAHKIVKNVIDRQSEQTRIFSFGVGDNVNAMLLDTLADKTRSVSAYVREHEDIEDKISRLYDKISKPVLTDLALNVPGMKLSEIYPTKLPDMFHGSQLVVLGRYDGTKSTTVKLTGRIGKKTHRFKFKLRFPAETKRDKVFVEELWARRKVGYLLGQIRYNGSNKELKDEVISLAKKYGIVTPYTSYLIAPDQPTPVVTRPPYRPPYRPYLPIRPYQPVPTFPNRPVTYPHLQPYYQSGPNNTGKVLVNYPINITPIRGNMNSIANVRPYSGGYNGSASTYGVHSGSFSGSSTYSAPTRVNNVLGATTNTALPVTGKQGVDLSVRLNKLQQQTQVTKSTLRKVAGRTFRQEGDRWVDVSFKKGMKTVTVKALSDAYFELLSAHPELREALQLGNHVTLVTQAQTALVIVPNGGQEQLTRTEMDALFTKAP